jgi:hypothetical protein
MRRTTRFTLRYIALGLAVAAIAPATARAQPVDFWNYDPQTGEKIANTSPGIAPDELARRFSVSNGGSQAPDDRAFSRATNVSSAPTVADTGSDGVGWGIVVGSAMALVLAVIGGALLVIRHGRPPKPSPA